MNSVPLESAAWHAGVYPKAWISVVAEDLPRSHLSGPGVPDILIELVVDKELWR